MPGLKLLISGYCQQKQDMFWLAEYLTATLRIKLLWLAPMTGIALKVPHFSPVMGDSAPRWIL